MSQERNEVGDVSGSRRESPDETSSSLPGLGILTILRRKQRTIIPLGVVILVWQALPTLGIVDPIFLPPFHDVVLTFYEKMLIDGELTNEMFISLERGFIAYGLAVVLATPLGVLVGWKKVVYEYTSVLIDILRSMPAVALIPIFLLVFGPSETTIIAIIFWPVFFYQLIAVIYGTQNINQTLIDSMRVIGMRDVRLFREVYLPGSMPGIFTGLRQTVATMLILTIVAEMLLASDGLGTYIMQTQRNFQVSETYAGILLIAILGYALSKGIVLVQDRLFHWAEGSNN